ncbi:unnamed protein product [Amoebophrya sp. A120]|nr:unnamed protein product [Amoebophrya sp. A120]|eukprot:GSA120T00000552001.1
MVGDDEAAMRKSLAVLHGGDHHGSVRSSTLLPDLFQHYPELLAVRDFFLFEVLFSQGISLSTELTHVMEGLHFQITGETGVVQPLYASGIVTTPSGGRVAAAKSGGVFEFVLTEEPEVELVEQWTAYNVRAADSASDDEDEAGSGSDSSGSRSRSAAGAIQDLAGVVSPMSRLGVSMIDDADRVKQLTEKYEKTVFALLGALHKAQSRTGRFESWKIDEAEQRYYGKAAVRIQNDLMERVFQLCYNSIMVANLDEISKGPQDEEQRSETRLLMEEWLTERLRFVIKLFEPLPASGGKALLQLDKADLVEVYPRIFRDVLRHYVVQGFENLLDSQPDLTSAWKKQGDVTRQRNSYLRAVKKVWQEKIKPAFDRLDVWQAVEEKVLPKYPTTREEALRGQDVVPSQAGQHLFNLRKPLREWYEMSTKSRNNGGYEFLQPVSAVNLGHSERGIIGMDCVFPGWAEQSLLPALRGYAESFVLPYVTALRHVKPGVMNADHEGGWYLLGRHVQPAAVMVAHGLGPDWYKIDGEVLPNVVTFRVSWYVLLVEEALYGAFMKTRNAVEFPASEVALFQQLYFSYVMRAMYLVERTWAQQDAVEGAGSRGRGASSTSTSTPEVSLARVFGHAARLRRALVFSFSEGVPADFQAGPPASAQSMEGSRTTGSDLVGDGSRDVFLQDEESSGKAGMLATLSYYMEGAGTTRGGGPTSPQHFQNALTVWNSLQRRREDGKVQVTLTPQALEALGSTYVHDSSDHLPGDHEHGNDMNIERMGFALQMSAAEAEAAAADFVAIYQKWSELYLVALLGVGGPSPDVPMHRGEFGLVFWRFLTKVVSDKLQQSRSPVADELRRALKNAREIKATLQEWQENQQGTSTFVARFRDDRPFLYGVTDSAVALRDGLLKFIDEVFSYFSGGTNKPLWPDASTVSDLVWFDEDYPEQKAYLLEVIERHTASQVKKNAKQGRKTRAKKRRRRPAAKQQKKKTGGRNGGNGRR